MRLAAPLLALALAAALLGGCGSSGGSTSNSTGSAGSHEAKGATAPHKARGATAPHKAKGATAPAGASTKSCPLSAGGASGLRATGVSCGQAQKVALAWGRQAACAAHPGASHSACAVRRYRCLGTVTARGLAVSCARPSRSIAFTAKRP
jgi:hypothetical protein